MKNPVALIVNSIQKWMRPKERMPFPITLQHRRLYIFPTRHGIVFFAILLAILLGAINQNNNLGFILAFLLGGMSFISVFHTFRNLFGLTLVSARAIPVFTGQTASFGLCLENHGRARWSLVFNFDNQKQTVIDLASGDKQTISVSHAADKRGILRPDILTISTNYPLGLFRCWSHHFLDAQCLVYPLPIKGPRVTDHGLAENDNEGESGGPGVDDFAGLKSYQPGDPMQHLSWKSFSRGQGLQKKMFEGQLGKNVYFDPDVLPGQDLEWKLSRICHMILQAEALRTPYGLRFGSDLIEPSLGSNHKRSCLQRLALVGQGNS